MLLCTVTHHFETKFLFNHFKLASVYHSFY